MPSLLGTTVATNYGKMSAQQTYGTDNNFSNFGTRNLRFLKITATSDGSTAIDFSSSTVYSTTGFTDFSAVVRTLQTFGELYLVGPGGSAAFLVAVSGDTLADGTSVASPSTPSYTNVTNAIVAALKANVTSRTGATATVALMTVGASNGGTIA